MKERQVTLGEREVSLRMTWRPSARRLSLRIDPSSGGLSMSLPACLSEAEALSFLEKNAGWAFDRLNRLPEHIPFEDGREIPFLGQSHKLRHAPEARRGVWREEGMIHVSGQASFLARRVRDFLKTEAKRELNESVRAFSALLPESAAEKLGKVVLRDTKSRWGSCSAYGDLSFSWRLILAPRHVLEYVAAHEVCHLRHHDHSAAFWRTVEVMQPNYIQSKDWLKKEGNRLHRYG